MNVNKPNKIITHTAVSQKWHTAQDVDVWHKARWPGFTSKQFKNDNGRFYHVGYHYVIEWDGKIVQTRGHNEEGAHCIGQNTSSIGVCFMGNGDLYVPSTRQKTAWKRLFKKIHKEFPNINSHDIYPHRKYANKTCHGALLSDTYYRDLLAPSPYDKEKKKELIRQLEQLVTRLRALLTKKRMR